MKPMGIRNKISLECGCMAQVIGNGVMMKQCRLHVAAPDLLAACKIALPILEEYADGYLEERLAQADFINSVVEPMRAAIADAEKE